MMEGESSSRNIRAIANDSGFTDIIFSWSLEDIFNENLYKDQVENIAQSFESIHHYRGSFVYPLFEETRAQLCSSMEIISEAPFGEVVALEESKPYGAKLYDVKIDCWKNRFTDRGKEPYKTLPGDVFVLTDSKPETVHDLQRVGRSWTFLSVSKITEDENEDVTSTYFKVNAFKEIGPNEWKQKSLFVVFLINITPNRRIWSALHISGNLQLNKEILCTDNLVSQTCDYCSPWGCPVKDENFLERESSKLNKSQHEAILACLSTVHCCHKSTVELIWGPPGTGKTKTLSTLLFILLKMNFKVLTCAPTNVAIKEVASRLLTLKKESFKMGPDVLFCSLGDVLLFGNNERLKVGSEIEDIYLDYRVKQLSECFAPSTGWRMCFTSLIDLLEHCVSQYHIFLENDLIKEKEHLDTSEIKVKKAINSSEGGKEGLKSFLQFLRERFVSIVLPLRKCVSILCTHIAKSYILEHNFDNMVHLIEILDSFEALLFQDTAVSELVEDVFSLPQFLESSSLSFTDMPYVWYKMRTDCLSVLNTLKQSLGKLDLPSSMSKESIQEFCFRTSSLIFATASSSYKLHFVKMEPLNILVIDEAAQLKECESLIPLLLPGIRHAILVGDECQLPATVRSNVSQEAGFGRSLFERLSLLDHSKHLLNIQYRMHPSISFFPNSYFYLNQIIDAPNVKRKSYEKLYLPLPMFGPYSFINIVGGREELDDAGRSRRNMIEVAIVMKILKKLHKAYVSPKVKLSIGVVSPYAAQVVSIQEKLGKKYDAHDGFVVNVKSIDGFQGGEHDIIIISTVRTNSRASLEFISNPQRTNVALTRARHCLWILGSERTLASDEAVWEAILLDAKNRQCFFNADEDKDMAKAILDVKKELDQFDDLLNKDSVLFRSARWKVLFSDNFLKSFKKLRSDRTKKSVVNLLLKLSSGWRPKKGNMDSFCGSSLQILKRFRVEGLYLMCSIDIVKESRYIQVLKIWDILSPEDIHKLEKRLDVIFGRYTDDFINHCKEKCLERNLEVPMSWTTSVDVIRFRDLTNVDNEDELSISGSEGRSYVENSKVGESLLLMKFYSLSSSVVSHLLSDSDGLELDLPFEVTDEELEMILYPKSTFILGRSGTGKTTVLTMKLFQKEKLHQMATEAFYGTNRIAPSCSSKGKEVEEDTEESKLPFLRQIFVTVSPKLCHAVKHHVTRLKRSICDDTFPMESCSNDMEDIDDATIQFKNIPDSFIDVSPNSYPLVITFHKFLMMLDGTLGNSYFDERFPGLRNHASDQNHGLTSVSIETFIRMREVNFDRFTLSYWQHFNSQLIRKLDSCRVFTEIISHIKGSPQTAETCDGKLSREDYVLLSESRASSLSRQTREKIYDIFQDYEKMKMKNGEFDLADLVIDLHHRLRLEKYKGLEMDFVYIDEVQDLTMSQIALFKYISQNVEEGFVFSGDTAQTIARGIDFRFQDIRCLFYQKFVLESRSSTNDELKEKAKISDIFHLSQNFRTHAGVLRLSQSIIELLYRFFPQSIDVLKPETSFIYGEAPVLLESGNSENAIVKIFGNSENTGGKIVGFGAEQVILVRDDGARKEILNYVGKHALVLTILECKGLEFQDVLLYNFFGSSPFKNKWRVIYEYMKEQDLVNSTAAKSYPRFNESKHSLLCSELKQLYVAVTRTRQRLWICENIEDFSKPMFDYWKKKFLVQSRQLDDSLAQAMQVASTPEEWKLRGIKLFHECNYEMATMCFERAGDTYWERRSKASGLRATADLMRSTRNTDDANAFLREAADLFESIGKADSAAQCFSDVGDYEKAGKLYLEKSCDPDLKRAGDCFSLAGCCELAAQVYARGNFFSDCLTVCAEGRLFDVGLDYIQHWRQIETTAAGVIRRDELDKIEQNFLERCALHYYQLKDTRSMMRFVKAFRSMDLMREFLRSSGLFDELLLLEEESGNFLEAANIAKLRGDILLEADLLGKAGKFTGASDLILFYVLANSLWTSGSTGWPLKQFTQKGELLIKAKSFAKNESDNFYEFVCAEVDVLSNEQSNIFTMMTNLNLTRRHKSIRGEILSLRKILDSHFELNSSKYVWQDEVIVDSAKYMEGLVFKNQVSVDTLVYFWKCWKEKVVNILEYLACIDVSEYKNYGQFAFNFLGVWKQISNMNEIYLLLNPDADWVKKMGTNFLKRNGKLVSVDVHPIISASRSYWCSELLSVGMRVLINLEALHRFSVKNTISVFCQSRSLTLIYEVAKLLSDSKFLNHSYGNLKALEKFVRFSFQHFNDYVFPLDWRKSLTENMVSLRQTEVSRCLLKEAIHENIRRNGRLTYGQLGRIAVMILGLGVLDIELREEITRKIDDNSPWKVFIECFCVNIGPQLPQGSVAGYVTESLKKVYVLSKFYEALEDTYNANWRSETDYVSPNCFLYLVQRLLILSSYHKGYIFLTRSFFLEWFLFQDGNTTQNLSVMPDVKPSLRNINDFIARVINQLLFNREETKEWIRKSNTNVKDYYPLLVLRLISMLCLLHLNSGKYVDSLINCLHTSFIVEQLPQAFYGVLRKSKKQNVLANLNVFAEAFEKIDDPLVIVRLRNDSCQISCPNAFLVDLMVYRHKEDVVKTMFPKKVESVISEAASVEEATNSCSEVFSSSVSSVKDSNFTAVAGHVSNFKLNNEVNLPLGYNNMLDLFDTLLLTENEKDRNTLLSNAQKMKDSVNKGIQFLNAAGTEPLHVKPSNKNMFSEVVDELEQLSTALDRSEPELVKNISVIGQLSQKVLSRRPKLEHILSQLILPHNTNVVAEELNTSRASGNQSENDNDYNYKASEDKKADENLKASEATITSGTGTSIQETKSKGKKNNKPKKHKGGKRTKKW